MIHGTSISDMHLPEHGLQFYDSVLGVIVCISIPRIPEACGGNHWPTANPQRLVTSTFRWPLLGYLLSHFHTRHKVSSVAQNTTQVFRSGSKTPLLERKRELHLYLLIFLLVRLLVYDSLVFAIYYSTTTRRALKFALVVSSLIQYDMTGR